MVSGKFRSRTYARKRLVTPGGRNILRFVLRKPAKAKCSETGEPLHGVARGRPNQIKKLAKSRRRPSRPFGGVLSSRAMRKEFIKRARTKE